jgi:hypothetical protein
VYSPTAGEIVLPVLECSRCNELYYSAHGSTELSCAACGGEGWRVFEDEVSFARVSGLPRSFGRGDHGVLLYVEEDAAVDFCCRYVEEGIERGDQIIVALPEAMRAAILARLGDALDGAMVLESERLYGAGFDPQATAGEYRETIQSIDGSVRIVSGPDASAAAEIDPESFRHYERIAHELVIDLDATALCVYDGRRLPIAFSPVAVEGHPLISRNGAELRRNSDFSYTPAG